MYYTCLILSDTVKVVSSKTVVFNLSVTVPKDFVIRRALSALETFFNYS